MKKSIPFWLTIAFSVVALAASALLLVDYVRPAPVFCAEDGCSTIKLTALAHPFLDIPLPVFGITGILAIALLACIPGRRASIVQAMLAAFGGIVAIGLIGVQASLKSICPFCMAVDTSSIVLAGLSIWRAKKELDPPRGRSVGFGVGAALIAIAAPIAVGFWKKPILTSIPPGLVAEYEATPRGQITVIDFVDYECPFCRMTQLELEPVLAGYSGKVHLARKNVPLRMHAHAMDAAKAACCAELLGKGDAMAAALFKSEDLTPEGCETLATASGLSLDAFRACVKDPVTEAKIRTDIDTFKAAKGHGLPTIYVGTQKLEGAQDQASLRAAFDSALRLL